MKIRVLSDLHLEFTGYAPAVLPSCGEDLVVLAGDIGVGTKGIEWAMRAIPDRPVVYVLGNHEFYGHDWDRLLVETHAVAADSNVTVLENEAVEIGGLRILGCSLWTDFLVMGRRLADVAVTQAKVEMADYRLIRRNRRRDKLLPIHTIWRCHESRKWLEREIAGATGPLLVVTHHAPTLRTLNPRYLLDLSSAAFHNDFDALIRPPVRAWIHGHTHFSCREDFDGIPVISNQRGYPGEDTDFDWDFVVDLSTDL